MSFTDATLKLTAEEILISSYANPKFDGLRYRFWSVIRATSRTCELCELRPRIARQSGDLQEIEPSSSWIDEDCVIRCSVNGKVARINDDIFAVPWDGKSRWQTAIIHLY
jgi:hypothetical protein